MNVRPLAAALSVAFLSVTAYAQVEVKGDPAKGQPIAAQVCAACHGPDGNSPLPANPVIAGQPAWYLFKQLQNFKSEGGKPAERASPIMAGIVASLSREDMANVALYYSSQKPQPRAARDKDLVKAGEEIWRGGILKKGVPACAVAVRNATLSAAARGRTFILAPWDSRALELRRLGGRKRGAIV